MSSLVGLVSKVKCPKSSLVPKWTEWKEIAVVVDNVLVATNTHTHTDKGTHKKEMNK